MKKNNILFWIGMTFAIIVGAIIGYTIDYQKTKYYIKKNQETNPVKCPACPKVPNDCDHKARKKSIMLEELTPRQKAEKIRKVLNER